MQRKELRVKRKRKINKYPTAFRKLALERMKTCRNVSELTPEYVSLPPISIAA